MLARNSVKHAAATGDRVRGIHLTFPATAVIEVLVSERLDFVYIDGEHGRFDWRDIEIMCITAERHGLTPIARIPDPSSATITRFLDRGVRGIVVPHVESVDDANRVVDAAYFAPMGTRIPDIVRCQTLGIGWDLCNRSFASLHPGGSNALLADGAARFYNRTLDGRVFMALSTIAGGEGLPNIE